MAYTTPKTWATGDLLTAGDMNTYVRDNIGYVYDNKAPRLSTFSATWTTGINHTGTTAYTATGATLTGVVVPATSAVIVIAQVGRLGCNSTDGVSVRIYRATTGIGEASQHLLNGRETTALVARDASLAAGTYTYNLYVKLENAANTAYVSHVNLVAVVIPAGH